MFSFFVAIVLLALVNPISSLEHVLSLRNSSLKQNGIASGSRLSVHGGFDQDGLDSGIPSSMKEGGDDLWEFDMMTEFPSFFKVYSQRVDEKPPFYLSLERGDLQNLSVLSNISTFPILVSLVSLNNYPRSPHIAFRITVNETAKQYPMSAIGSRRYQITIYLLLGTLPIFIGFASIRIYMYCFYVVKVNKFGQAQIESILPLTIQSKMHHRHWLLRTASRPFKGENLHTRCQPTELWPSRQVLKQSWVALPFLSQQWNIRLMIGISRSIQVASELWLSSWARILGIKILSGLFLAWVTLIIPKTDGQTQWLWPFSELSTSFKCSIISLGILPMSC